jgi:FAD/FMN-containing dehydrogenase
MGLTGVIVGATLTLHPVTSSTVEETVVKAPTLDGCLDAFEEHADARYSVAWIDLVAAGPNLGRSLVMLGDHAENGELRVEDASPRIGVPMEMPSMLLNRGTVTLFNRLYDARVRGPVLRHSVGYRPFFYPLDAVADWNRLYGRRGFLQYQLVIPADRSALREIVARVARAGTASPLAVLKQFGPANDNPLSFPRPGYTLAMDFKPTPEAFALCDELDGMVLAAGGVLYLTKDARMSAETFHASYPRVPEFEGVRRKYGAVGVFASVQSRRLELA